MWPERRRIVTGRTPQISWVRSTPVVHSPDTRGIAGSIPAGPTTFPREDTMPEAILKFKLPEETEEFETASNAGKVKSLIWDFDQWLRAEIKHGGKEEFQPVRDMLYELAAEAGIQID